MRKIVLLSALVVVISSCSSSSPEEILVDLLDKDSVSLTDLAQHAVTYEKTSDKTTQVDVYCPPNDLRDGDGNSNGDWTVSGDNLITNPAVGTAYIYSTTGALEKDAIVDTDKADSFKIINISETICL